MQRVFLGGTANGSTWRDDIIPLLDNAEVSYFNPIVDGEWTEADKERELSERDRCDFCLYTITPKMVGVYSIAEVVDDSVKRPKKVILTVLQKDGENEFNDAQWSSLESVGKLVEKNGGYFCTSLEAAVLFMYQSTGVALEDLDPSWPWKNSY